MSIYLYFMHTNVPQRPDKTEARIQETPKRSRTTVVNSSTVDRIHPTNQITAFCTLRSLIQTMFFKYGYKCLNSECILCLLNLASDKLKQVRRPNGGKHLTTHDYVTCPLYLNTFALPKIMTFALFVHLNRSSVSCAHGLYTILVFVSFL